MLIEFWDFCRPNSLHTLPYLKGWDERYRDDGLRVIGVHASGFPPSGEVEAVRAAVQRLQVPYPVVVDEEFEIWQDYGNLGWPARYLFTGEGRLFDYHYGEGGYDETERAIQELLGVRAADDGAAASRGRAGRRARTAVRGCARGLQRTVRGRRGLGGGGRRGHVTANGETDRRRRAGRLPADLTPGQHRRRCWSWTVGDGVTCPRGVLHPRPRWLSRPAG